MTRKVLLLFVAITLNACASGPKPPSFVREYEPVEAKGFEYEDKNLKLTYTPASFRPSVPIMLVNKSDKPIKVIWDECAFINPTGQSERVIHEGVRLLEKNSSMPPSIIPPKASFADAVMPASRINWTGTSWHYGMICGSQELVPFRGMAENDAACLGQTFGLFIVYQIDGRKQSFTTKFRMKSRVESSSPVPLR